MTDVDLMLAASGVADRIERRLEFFGLELAPVDSDVEVPGVSYRQTLGVWRDDAFEAIAGVEARYVGDDKEADRTIGVTVWEVPFVVPRPHEMVGGEPSDTLLLALATHAHISLTFDRDDD